MPDTAIELRRGDNKGAVQQGPEYILSITYPTADVQIALRQISTARGKRPILLMGDRGRGKSHIMAVAHHALGSPATVEAWAHDWGARAGVPLLSALALEQGFHPISEPVHNHEYPVLWDLLFDRHPRGEFFRGKFAERKEPFPRKSLIKEMLKA